MKHLADDFVKVITSPEPQSVYCYSPGLAVLPNGRLVATMDFGGPGVEHFPGAVQYYKGSGRWNSGRIFISDDHGQTWVEKAQVSMLIMRPFVAGGVLYVIGASPDLGVMRSDDQGNTWSGITHFSQGEIWHQAPSNVWYKDEFVYLVFERETDSSHTWPMDGNAPVLMRGDIRTDLTRRENWTFASELVFNREIDEKQIPEWGIPFQKSNIRVGWLETNVVQLLKPDDMFFDPTGRTFHLFLRTWTGLPWTGAMMKVVEKDDGSMESMFERAPSGQRMVFTHIPGGGGSKFHMLYDDKTKTYWLLTNQFTDSMADLSKIPKNDRSGYDRSRLVLYYSRNCFDWLFAGVVTAGETRRQSRSYASMAIDGDNLLVLSRSGDENTCNGHDTNMITFHRVKDFRSLADI